MFCAVSGRRGTGSDELLIQTGISDVSSILFNDGWPRGVGLERRTRSKYEPVMGLEGYVQLNTRTKIFCGCPPALARRLIPTFVRCAWDLPGAFPC